MKKLIAQGAEAKIFLDDKIILKERIPKTYRLPELDEKIRKSRTKREAKILTKAIEFANVPKVLNTNKKGEPFEKYNLQIEFIEGDKLAETLNDYEKEKQEKVMKDLGKQLAKLHKQDIIHGDLTTSNTIFSKDNRLFIIDFGLGFISKRLEDKAVDLHLIKQALNAKHFQNSEELYKKIIEGYDLEEKSKVLDQLEKVEARGRYRH